MTQAKPIDRDFWNRIWHIREAVKHDIAATAATMRAQILDVGRDYGLDEGELVQRGVLEPMLVTDPAYSGKASTKSARKAKP